jgi:hypothetical protein
MPSSKKEKLSSIPTTLPQLIIDFVRDLSTTFPEYAPMMEKWSTMESLGVVLKDEKIVRGKNEITYLFDYIAHFYPERFFDILYQNDDIFLPTATVLPTFLPQIDFRLFFHCPNVTQTTKDAIWKYLQLILFSLTSSMNKMNFGEDTKSLFDGIDETELQEKIKEAVSGITEFFTRLKPTTSESSEEDVPEASASASDKSFEPDAKNIFENLQKMFNGKIGSLAKQLMEEMSEEVKDLMDELGLSEEGESKLDFKKLMKNPQKIMTLIKKMSEKLKQKMQSGELPQEELMKEATEFMKQFKEMGGANSEKFKEMFKNMGLGKNAKLDMNALTRMEKKMKMAERMRANVEKKRATTILPLQKREDGTKIFTVPGGEVQEKSTKEDIERILKEIEGVPPPTNHKAKKRSGKN